MKLKSSVPGLTYPSSRDDSLKTGKGFLECRRREDGAENLWRVHNSLYDLSNFEKSHPGGREFISLTRGTDITELFEVHHITDRARALLPKLHVREATTPRRCAFTFHEQGFYKKFIARARVALEGVDFHNPSKFSKFTNDVLLVVTLGLCVYATWHLNAISVFFSAIFLTMTINASHNFLHMKDQFRVYYMDLSLMSSREFRISHALSHHMYTNTLWDMEIYAFEPFLFWLPRKRNYASRILRKCSLFYSPFFWLVIFFGQALRRYCVVLAEKRLEFRDFVPFLLPTLMSLAAPSPWLGIKVWFWVITTSSFLFGYVGLNASHHHPDVFHDGDVYREDMDWGLLQLDAVRVRRVIDDNLFLALTNYGYHCLHHLMPTVDHAYLPLCEDAFRKTLQEFGIAYKSISQWEAIKGQFRQLVRDEAKSNAVT